MMNTYLCVPNEKIYCPSLSSDAHGLYVPFNFEEGGTRVVYYAPEVFDVSSTKEE